MEAGLRAWLMDIHMQTNDIGCFIDKIKASQWRTDPPSYNVPQVKADQFLHACGIEKSELYTITYDSDHRRSVWCPSWGRVGGRQRSSSVDGA
jgi:hypothetical protein